MRGAQTANWSRAALEREIAAAEVRLIGHRAALRARARASLQHLRASVTAWPVLLGTAGVGFLLGKALQRGDRSDRPAVAARLRTAWAQALKALTLLQLIATWKRAASNVDDAT